MALFNSPCRSTVIVPWGSEGASAKAASSDQIFTAPASSPEVLVDTLGAGDTFIGAFIAAKTAGRGLESCLEFACRVAGHKCGHKGFANTAELACDFAALTAGGRS